MAWLLGGVVGTVFISYVANETAEAYDQYISKPVKNYLDERQKEAFINACEMQRQSRISERKIKKEQVIDRLVKINVAVKKLSIYNNTEDVVDIIFVNKDRGTTENDVVSWSHKVLKESILTRTNTKRDMIGVSNHYHIIQSEIREYTIVLHINGKFVLLKQEDFKNQVAVKDKFYTTNHDVSCTGFW